jgi:hypothetical protein
MATTDERAKHWRAYRPNAASARMAGMEQLSDAINESVRRWQNHGKPRDLVVCRMAIEPEAVCEFLVLLDEHVAESAAVVRRYGMELKTTCSRSAFDEMAPERCPET